MTRNMDNFEAWFRAKSGLFRNYEIGYFWHWYREEFGEWPTREMKAKGQQIYDLELAKRK